MRGPTGPIADAKRLTLFLGARDRAGHRLLAVELLDRARRAGMVGASVFEALSGTGRSGVRHAEGMLAHDAPLAVVIVDEGPRIEAFLDGLGDVLAEPVVVLADVTAFRLAR